jgi:phage gp29-like protein
VMRDVLTAFRNASVAVFSDPEGGTRVQPVEASGNGEAFLHAFEVEDREIVKAILTATLSAGEGEHASRAQAGVHQDVTQTLYGQIKGVVAAMLRRQVLRRLVTYNYGAKLARLTPRASLGTVTKEDLAKIWTAVAALETSGYLDRSQRQPLDVKVSLPERDVEAATTGATGAQTEVDGGAPPATEPAMPPATEEDGPPEPDQTGAVLPAPAVSPPARQQQRRAA